MYQHILVPIDGSATAERGLREAICLAAGQKARLRLLTVVDTLVSRTVQLSPLFDTPALLTAMRQEAQALLDAAQARAREAGVPAETVLREDRGSSPADAILDEAARHACDLIVMGTHGRRGLNRLTLGSDAELVLRASPVPVLLVRHEARP
jgi:nucleotide-binding universal stress UspA family protein